jgi:hypothetical protein
MFGPELVPTECKVIETVTICAIEIAHIGYVKFCFGKAKHGEIYFYFYNGP